ncbi:MAG TPA: hypothetical protein VI386_05415 [Candidatus Sulfotelmatobacter sp.]
MLFPVDGEEPGLAFAGFVDPCVEPPAVPGKDPQGEPLGEVPGVLEVFGFTVEGCVLLPGVGLFGELEPGTVPGVEGFVVLPVEPVPAPGVEGEVWGVAVPAGGVAVPGRGLAVPAGGVAVPEGGVAVPGVEL